MDGHIIMKYFMLNQLTNKGCSITWHVKHTQIQEYPERNNK